MLTDGIREQRIKVVTGQKTVRVNGNSIVAEDAEGRKGVFREDMVVLALGMKPNKRLMEDLKGKISEVQKIGNYKKTERVCSVIHEALTLAGKFNGVIQCIGEEANSIPRVQFI